MKAESDVQCVADVHAVLGEGPVDHLYVTSASIGLDGAALEAQPQAGGLFMASPGVRGVPEIPFAG